MTTTPATLPTTGTGLDRIVEAILADPGLNTTANPRHLAQRLADNRAGAAAAADINALIHEAVLATGIGADGTFSYDDVIAINTYIRADAARYERFLVAHGNDEAGVETGYHLVQCDGATTQLRGQNFANTVADGIYHIGFIIQDGRFVNEDGDANARVTEMRNWLNYFYFGSLDVNGTDGSETLRSGFSSAVFANSMTEHFIAGAGNDRILAGEGNDWLQGGRGNDYLDGGAGADTLDGGEGNDTLVYDAADNAANIQGGAGTDCLLVLDQAAPTGFNLASHGFEAARVVLTDTLGRESWAAITEAYNGNWQIVTRDQVNDNGSSTHTDFDVNNRQVWTSNARTVDIDGLLISERTVMDSGETRIYSLTQVSQNAAYAALQEEFGASGGRSAQRIYNHDNSYRFFFWDADSGNDWSTFDDEFNAAGQRWVERVSYDNGTQRYYYWDTAAAQSWSVFDEEYNAAGQRLVQRVQNDDGTTSQQFWDVAGQQSWSSLVDYYNAQGQRIEQRLFLDEGSYTRTHYDAANAETWATRTESYNANGVLTGTSYGLD